MSSSETIRRERFAEHLRRNRSRLFGYIHTIVRNLADTDDIFQQTTQALWRRFDAYHPSRRFLTRACRAARLETATRMRKHARARLCFSDGLTPLRIDAFAEIGDEETGDRQAALPACLDKPDELNRLLVAECNERGVEVAELARRLGRSPPSAHNTLRRIRRILFDRVERRIERAARN